MLDLFTHLGGISLQTKVCTLGLLVVNVIIIKLNQEAGFTQKIYSLNGENELV